ncbi:MAG: hypothetical protein BWY92_01842 [Firmicutes bacterium ADurb.BinA052]|nr:MAG: hypothetical protein BWY92_01842 [Firmicutes bacterium ADurb.BinA052]
MAFHTLSMSECMVIAPVGQTLAHCPHCTQSTSARFLPNAGPTTASEPRYEKSSTPIFCTSPHTRTQSPQSMHLLGSRTSAGVERSRGRLKSSSPNLTSVTPNRLASSWSLHAPFLLHVVHSRSWLASRSSRIVRLMVRSCSVFVRTTIPGRGSTVQDATMPILSISTTHILQAPYTESSEW